MRRLLRGCLLWFGFWIDSARAEPAVPAVAARLELEAAPSCATWPALVAGVARRSSRIRLVTTTTATPSLFASLRSAADGSLVAELLVVNAGGRRAQRRLLAPSCAEAVDALALVIAITLDPASVTAGGEDSTAKRPADEASAPELAEPAKADAARVNAGENQPRRAKRELNDEAAQGVPASPGAMDVRLHWRVGAAFVAASGPAPQLMPGLGLGLLAAWERTGLLSPAARVSAAHYWLSGLRETDGTADFQLDAGSVDVCPIRLRGGPLAIRACANVQAGRMLASGSRTFSARSKSRPFVVLGGSSLVTASLPAGFEAGASLAVGRALVEDEYVFANRVFYRVPQLSLGFGLGFGYGFH